VGVHQRGHGDFRRIEDQEIHVPMFAIELSHLGPEVIADSPHYIRTTAQHLLVEDSRTVLRHEDQVNVKWKRRASRAL